MKIRQGFVSNSSSASFILTVKLSLADFCKEFCSPFDVPEFEREIKAELKELKIHINKYKGSKDKLHQLWFGQYNSRSKELKQILSQLSKLSLAEKIKKYFDFHGYTLQEDELGNTTVYGWTVMYNSEEDTGEIFLELQKKLDKKGIPYKVEVHDEG